MSNSVLMILSAVAVIAAAVGGYLLARANARAAESTDRQVLDFLQVTRHSLIFVQGAFAVVTDSSRMVGKPSVDVRKAVLSVLDGEKVDG